VRVAYRHDSCARRVPANTAEALRLFDVVGSDRALTLDEVRAGDAASSCDWSGLAQLWEAYETHWRRFTGARLDPQFARLDHPARLTGSVRVTDATPIVIVGTGPSLRRSIADLRRVRSRMHLFTSPRGADALDEFGLTADLVLVEHQSPIDAQFTLQERWHRGRHAMTRAIWVAADSRTPAALLEGIPSDRLFVPLPLPSWGYWPATAAALALGSGARAVALVGIDLGTSDWPDPAHRPLRALLEWLAAHADVPCIDAGRGGSVKRHWRAQPLDALVVDGAAAPLAVSTQPWQDAGERLRTAVGLAERLAPVAGDADAVLIAASAIRDGDTSRWTLPVLEDRWRRLLQMGMRPDTRLDIQEGLGATFLPRYWRVPPTASLGPRLWRPAALAVHELLGLYRSLRRRTHPSSEP
jgi:hypothetical protein